MKVILLKSVPKIGSKYQVLDVADGYAMNALLPRGLAQVATKSALARVAELKLTEDVDRKVREDLLMKNLASIADVTVEYVGKANEKGHLFAGIHKEEIIDALKKQDRVDITPEYLILDKPIKEVGEHKITVDVQGKTAEFTLVVKAL